MCLLKRKYTYSFDSLARTLNAFTEAIGTTRYAIYIFDYGAPAGLRLAMAHPERISAIISQNGNAYEEGLGDAWGPIRKYWSAPTAENREVLRQNILNLEGHPLAVHPRGSGSRESLRLKRTRWMKPAGTPGQQGNSAGFVP